MDTEIHKLWKVLLSICMILTLLPMGLVFALDNPADGGAQAAPVVEVQLSAEQQSLFDAVVNAYGTKDLMKLYVLSEYEEALRNLKNELVAMDEATLNSKTVEEFKGEFIALARSKVLASYEFVEGDYNYDKYVTAKTAAENELNTWNEFADFTAEANLIAIAKFFADAKTDAGILKSEKEYRLAAIKGKFANTGIYEEDLYNNAMREIENAINSCGSIESLEEITANDYQKIKEILNPCLKNSIEVVSSKKIAWVEQNYPDTNPSKYKDYSGTLDAVKDFIKQQVDPAELNTPEFDAQIKKMFEDNLTDEGVTEQKIADKVKQIKGLYPFDESLYREDEYNNLINEIEKDIKDNFGDFDVTEDELRNKLQDKFEGIKRPEDLDLTPADKPAKYLETFTLSVYDKGSKPGADGTKVDQKKDIDLIKLMNDDNNDEEFSIGRSDKIKLDIKGRLFTKEPNQKDQYLTGNTGVKKKQRIVMELPGIIKQNGALVDENGNPVKAWSGYVVDSLSNFGRQPAETKFGTDVDENGNKIEPYAVGTFKVIPKDDKNLLIVEYLDGYFEENSSKENPEYAGIQNMKVSLEAQLNPGKVMEGEQGAGIKFGNIVVNANFVDSMGPEVEVSKYFCSDYNDENKILDFNWSEGDDPKKDPRIKTSEKSNKVYYKVVVKAKESNLEVLENVIVSEYLNHKKLKNIQLVKAQIPGIAEDITKRVKQVNYRKEYTDCSNSLNEAQLKDVPNPQEAGFFAKKPISYNIGNLNQGSSVELIFSADINVDEVNSAIRAIKNKGKEADGIHFDANEMKVAQSLRNDVFVTADNLHNEKGKKAVTHTKVQPILQNDMDVDIVGRESAKFDDYSKPNGGKNRNNSFNWSIAIKSDQANKYDLTYVPILFSLSSYKSCGSHPQAGDYNAKLKYIQNIEIVDDKGNVLASENKTTRNSDVEFFRLLRNDKGEIYGFAGSLKELKNSKDGTEVKKTLHVKVSCNDDFWKEDRDPREEYPFVKCNNYKGDVKLGKHKIPENNKPIDFIDYERLYGDSNPNKRPSDYSWNESYRKWLGKSGAITKDKKFIDWTITVYPDFDYPEALEKERIIRDIIPENDATPQEINGEIKVVYKRLINGKLEVVKEKTLPKPQKPKEIDPITIEKEYSDCTIYVTVPTKILDSDTYVGDKRKFENYASVERDGITHYIKVSTDVEPLVTMEKVLVEHGKLDEATWRLELNGSLSHHEYTDENGGTYVKTDSLSDHCKTNNMYFEVENGKLKDFKVLVYDEASTSYRELHEDEYDVELQYFDELTDKNKDVLKGKVVGFKLTPKDGKSIPMGKNVTKVEYKTKLIRPPFGTYEGTLDEHGDGGYKQSPIEFYENEAVLSVWGTEQNKPKENLIKRSVYTDKSENKEVFVYYSHKVRDKIYWHVCINANNHLNEYLNITDMYKELSSETLRKTTDPSSTNNINYAYDTTGYFEVPEGLQFEGVYRFAGDGLERYKWINPTNNKTVNLYESLREAYSSTHAPQQMGNEQFDYSTGCWTSKLDYFKVSQGTESSKIVPINFENVAVKDYYMENGTHGKMNYVSNSTWNQFVVVTKIVDKNALLGIEKKDDPDRGYRYKARFTFDQDHSPKAADYDVLLDPISDESLSDEIKFNVLSKNIDRNKIKGLTVPYSIQMNKEGIDLDPDGNTIRLFDTSSENLVHDPSSVEVNSSRLGKPLKRITKSEWDQATDEERSQSFMVDSSLVNSRHTLILTVPDNDYLQITYNMRIKPSFAGSDDLNKALVSNMAYFGDYVSYEELPKKPNDEIIIKPIDGASKGQNQIFVRKVNEEGELLQGVTYEWQYYDNGWRSSETNTNPKIINFDTDKDIKVEIPAYKLSRFKEIKAIEGYECNPNYEYVSIVEDEDFGDTAKLKEKLDKIEKPDGFNGEISYLLRNNTFDFTDRKIQKVSFKKVDAKEANKQLEGAEFKLYNTKANKDVYTRKEVAKIPQSNNQNFKDFAWTSKDKPFETNIVSGEYILVEEKAPIGYKTMNPKLVSVTKDGKITTYDLDENDQNNPGADSVMRYTKAKDSKEEFNTNEIVLKNTKADLLLKKYKENGKDPFAGVTFEFKKDGADKGLDLTTIDDGSIDLSVLELGSTYVVTEKNPTDQATHYIPLEFTVKLNSNGTMELVSTAKGQEDLVAVNNDDKVLDVINKKTHVDIEIRDKNDHKFKIPNEFIRVKEKDSGNGIENWSTDGVLEAEKAYIVEELKPVKDYAGYVPVKEFEFTLGKDRTVMLAMHDSESVKVNGSKISIDNIKPKVIIHKLNEEDAPLTGANFKVFANGKETGKVVPSPDGTSFEISELEIDTDYEVVEEAPAKYVAAEAFNIRFDKSGNVTLSNNSSDIKMKKDSKIEINVNNQPIKITLKLVDKDDTNVSLEGKFTVTDVKKEITLDGKTTVDGVELKDLEVGKTYKITQTGVQEKYKKIKNPISFKVNKDGEVEFISQDDKTKRNDEVEMNASIITLKNEKLEVRLQKVDAENNVLKGSDLKATFKVEGLGIFTTGDSADGTVKLDEIVAGKTYTVKETTPPNMYKIGEEFTVTVDEFGKVSATGEHVSVNDHVVTVKNEKTKISLKLVDKTSKNPLVGGTLVVKDKDGTVIPFTKGDEISELVVDRPYTIEETVTPELYKTIKNPITFKLKNNGTIVLDANDDASASGTTLTVMNEKLDVRLRKVDTENNVLTGSDLEATFVVEGLGTFTTGKSVDGTVKLDEIVAGKTYTVKETIAPKKYQNCKEFTLSVDEHNVVIYDGKKIDGHVVDVPNAKTKVMITFKDVDGNVVPGGNLVVTGGDGKIELPTDQDTHILEGKLEVGKVYTITEETVPDKHKKITDTVFKLNEDGKVVIIEDGKELDPKDPQIDLVSEKLKLKLHKVNEDGTKGLEGAKFKFNGNTYTSEKDGYVYVTDISAGTYEVEETVAPRTYMPHGKFTFSIDQNNVVRDGEKVFKDSVIEVENKPTKTTITIIGEDDEVVPGGELEVVDVNGNVVDTIPTSDRSKTITGKFVVDETYTIREKVVPPTHKKLKDTKFKVDRDGNVVMIEYGDGKKSKDTEITLVSKKLRIVVEKTDLNEKPLDGATFKLHKDGAEVNGVVYKENENTVEMTGMLKDVVYDVVETIAPKTYQNAKSFQISIDENGVVTCSEVDYVTQKENVLVVKNDKTRMQMNLIDQDTKEPLVGEFEIRGDKGELVVKTSDKPNEITGLIVGKKYTVVETKTPDGYQRIDAKKTPIAFTLLEDGTIRVDNGDTVTVVKDKLLTVLNKKTVVTIHKYDEMDTSLEGAVFEIDGVKGRFTTSKVGTVEVTGLKLEKEYTLHEVESPKRYIAGEDLVFSLDDQVVNEVVVHNEKAKYFVESYAEDVMLDGCEYEIYDGDTLVTKVTEPMIEDVLERNKIYTIKEVKVKDGYVFVDDARFMINERGELVLDGTFEDASLQGVHTLRMNHTFTRLGVRKVDESKHRLMGAVFELIDEDTDTVVHTWTSHDLKDEKIIKVLACDHRYVLKEVKVVDGYEDKQGDIHIAIDHNGRAMVDNEVVELLVKVNNKIPPVHHVVKEEPKSPTGHGLDVSTGDQMFVKHYAMVLVSAIVGVVVSCVRLMK